MEVQIINSIAIGVTLIVNGLSVFGVFGNGSIRDVSNRRKTPFTPIWWIFGLAWGINYTWSIVWNIYTYLYPPLFTESLTRTPYNWIAEGFFNCLWIVLFMFSLYKWAMVAIVGYLTSILFTYFTLRVSYYPGQTDEQRFIEYAAVSIRLGWVLLATILMAFSTKTVKVTRYKTAVWTSILVVIAIDICFLWFLKDFIVVIPSIIGLIGIAVEQYQSKALQDSLHSFQDLEQMEHNKLNTTIQYEVTVGEDEKESVKDLLDEQSIPSILVGSIVSIVLLLILIVVDLVILYM